MKPSMVDFSAGLRTLRDKLGLTQEGMAQRLGASLGTYRKWEAGAFNPSGPWLIKILQACPDEEARVRLGAPPTPTSDRRLQPSSVVNRKSSIENPPEPPPPTRATLLARYRNVCIEGIELLYELARGGSELARDHLHAMAEAVSHRLGSLPRAELDNALRNLPGPTASPAPSRPRGETPPPPARRKPAR